MLPLFSVCSIPQGVSGEVSVTDRQKIWKDDLEVFGQWPSDVSGKKGELPDFPQFLPFMVRGKVISTHTGKGVIGPKCSKGYHRLLQ